MSITQRPEVWGGLECTVARVGDRVRDQVRETGHRDRVEADLDRIAALGIRTLRYPVLWETVASGAPGRADWSWHDRALGHARRLGLSPVAGLVHHGSGPFYTGLLDPDFPRLLARHAAAVARRYPWIDRYTPVNEPLTTARFSALYGHWFPHGRDYRDFLLALVNQCRATRLAMRAIRRVNPGAELVATDDLGRVFATPPLAEQARHENERRWLSFDLLFGRVDRHHPWWRILLDHGVPRRHLSELLDAEARPDIVGVNHYLTSERFLDHRSERYPQHLVGGNGRDGYADVEAVRVPLPPGALGPAARLREVWERYRTPVVMTEVHHGSSRDEQVRWLAECWRAAVAVRLEGADIRAVTVWSLFGTVDWNVLLTREAGIYEPGAFDVRGPAPRPTALAEATESLARTGEFDHPVLDGPGWWRRPTRFYLAQRPPEDQPRGRASARTLAIAGADGALRRALIRITAARGLATELMEPGDDRPVPPSAWAVLQLASDDPDCGGGELARRSRERGLRHAVVLPGLRPGDASRPAAVESDGPEPAALAARHAGLLEACPDALLIRTGSLFGPWESGDVVGRLLAEIVAGGDVAAGERLLSLSYLPDVVHVALDLLIDGEVGVRHLANPAPIPGRDLAHLLASRLGRTFEVVGGADGLADEPPALATERGELMPPLQSALDRYLADGAIDWRGAAPPLPIAAE